MVWLKEPLKQSKIFGEINRNIPPRRRLNIALYYIRNTITLSTIRCPSELMIRRLASCYMNNNAPNIQTNANSATWKIKTTFDKNKKIENSQTSKQYGLKMN